MNVRLPKKQANAKPERHRPGVLSTNNVSGQRPMPQNAPRSLLDAFSSFNDAVAQVNGVYSQGQGIDNLAVFDHTGNHDWIISTRKMAENACRTCFFEVGRRNQPYVRRWDRHVSQRVAPTVRFLVHDWVPADQAHPL